MIRRFAPLALALTLLACPAPKHRGGPTTPVERPVRGGVLRVVDADDVDFLDPQRAGSPAAFAVMRALHRGLMAFPSTGEPTPVPDLAAAPPTVSADGRTYTFVLRDGAMFGAPASRPVRASDVVEGLHRVLEPGARSPLAGYFHVIAGAEPFATGKTSDLAGVRARDDRTVTITLARPVNDLAWMLALPAASAVPSELGGKLRLAPRDIAPSGPYMLAPKDGYVPETSIHLVRNPAWSAEADPVRPAYVDEVRILIATSEEDARLALTRGTADLSLDTAPDLAAAASDPALRARVRHAPSACLRYLWMNTRIPPLNDARVRHTIAAAVDRRAILGADGGALAGQIAADLLPRGITGHRALAATPTIAPGARPAAPIELVSGDQPRDRAEAAAVVRSLSAVGITIRIRAVPIASLYVDWYEVPARRVAMGIATWCADWVGLSGRAMLTPLLDGRMITSLGNDDYAMVHAPQLERALDAAAVASPSAAEAAWQHASAVAQGLDALVPLVDLDEVALVSNRLGDLGATAAFPRGDLTAAWLRT